MYEVGSDHRFQQKFAISNYNSFEALNQWVGGEYGKEKQGNEHEGKT